MDVDKKTSTVHHQDKTDETNETPISRVEKDNSEEKNVKGEGYYEQLSFIDKPDDSKCDQSDKALSRIKCLVYVQFAMLGALYIAVIVVIIATTLKKDKDNTNWTPWSACSTTCGSGLQTRIRTCGSSTLATGDDQCSGNAKDILVCQMPPCSRSSDNINWTQWSPWSACSTTCGSGLQTRFRTCGSSTSATGDDQCSGNAKDFSVCQMPPCSRSSDNINWTQWSPWSGCSTTCGSGLQTRFRTCGSSTSATEDDQCSGNEKDFSVCHMLPCSRSSGSLENYASFAARMGGTGSFVSSNQRVVFKKILNNNMEGYNNNSGIFTAPLSGVYLFVFFIEIEGAYGKVELRVNDQLISNAVAYGMFLEFVVPGFENIFTFGSSKDGDTEDDLYKSIRCIGGRFSIPGFSNRIKIQPNLNDCPYKDGVVATGSNSAVTHVNNGDQVWIQTPENVTLRIRPEGTSFMGILLSRDD